MVHPAPKGASKPSQNARGRPEECLGSHDARPRERGSVTNRHDSPCHVIFGWFWRGISEPGLTSRGGVPIGVSLRSTRQGHARSFLHTTARVPELNRAGFVLVSCQSLGVTWEIGFFFTRALFFARQREKWVFFPRRCHEQKQNSRSGTKKKRPGVCSFVVRRFLRCCPRPSCSFVVRFG